MKTFHEIDELFGKATPMTYQGKVQNTSTGAWLVVGMITFVSIVGIIAIANNATTFGSMQRKDKAEEMP